jgi:hypothetical protein
MASKYEQVKTLYESYKNHPADGLRTYEKRLQKDTGNLTYQVSVPSHGFSLWFLTYIPASMCVVSPRLGSK